MAFRDADAAVKIAVVGAGAVGSLMACLLSQLDPAKVQTYIFARGEQYQAISAGGIQLHGWQASDDSNNGALHSRNLRCVQASADASDALDMQFEYVIVTVKSHSFASTLDVLKPMLGRNTAVITIQNGIPWWYKHHSELSNEHLESLDLNCVDPQTVIWDTVGPQRVLGAIARVVVEVVEPGVVKTFAPWARFAIGELDGSLSPRLRHICSIMQEAGMAVEPQEHIRQAVWSKLMGNAFFNPTTTLTLQTWAELAHSEHAGDIAIGVMDEVFRIAKAAGVDMGSVRPETHLSNFQTQRSSFKSSMLQDLERGRQLEVDALLTAPIKVGKAVGVPTPLLQMLRALVLMRVEVSQQRQQ